MHPLRQGTLGFFAPRAARRLPRPWQKLLGSGCFGLLLRCISRACFQCWVSCEGFLRPRPHCTHIRGRTPAKSS
eukprot:9474191-Pyramimonas_sp.AAC.1